MISPCQAGMGKPISIGFTAPLIPRLLDQRWWAARVTELGCGSKPVKAPVGKIPWGRSMVENPGWIHGGKI